jgi:hypothetical protein
MRLQFAKDLDTRLHPLLLPSKRCSEREELAPNAVLHFISTMSAPLKGCSVIFNPYGLEGIDTDLRGF